MLIGTGVLALLLLLVLLAERGGEHLWQDHQSPARFYCEPCDLRYRRDELLDQSDGICPRGHCVEQIRKGFSLGTVAIVTCLTFLAVAALLTYTGAVPIIP